MHEDLRMNTNFVTGPYRHKFFLPYFNLSSLEATVFTIRF